MSDELIDQLAKDAAERTLIRAMEYRNGTLTMDMEPALEIAAAFVACSRTLIKDAPNYTETKLETDISLAGESETWTFVVQRHGPGVMTPHEARMKAEERVRALEGAITNLRDQKGRHNTEEAYKRLMALLPD